MSNHQHIWHDTVDADDSFTNLITKIFPKSIGNQINCNTIGRVTEYNKNKHVCSVQILPLDSDDNKVAQLNDVLVPESIWRLDAILERQNEMNKLQNEYNKKLAAALPSAKVTVDYTAIWKTKDKQLYSKFFKVGTVVSVGFFDRELDNYQNNASNYKIETDRMHSLNDPFVIGVVKS